MKEQRRKLKGEVTEIVDNSSNNKTPNVVVNNDVVKSPSDTTVYRPALQKGKESDLLNQISNFVEGIHLESTTDANSNGGWMMPAPKVVQKPTPVNDPASKEVDRQPVRDVMERALLQAEQYKAQVAMPTSNMQDSHVENDDDFFQVTCHIDGTLKEKIEGGEFVDLDRLLPKERSGYRNHDDTKLELIVKDGVAYIVAR